MLKLKQKTLPLTCFFVLFFLLLQINLHASNSEPRPFTARIIDGKKVSSDSYPTVGIVRGKNGAQCTGTLISPRHVLTAAHCLFNESNNQVLFDKDVAFELPTGEYYSEKVTINPTYVSRSEACVEGESDVSIIKLTKDVIGVTPSSIASTAPYLSSTSRLVGYGLEGNGATGMSSTLPSFGQVDTGLTTIEQISNTFVAWTFDPGEANTAAGDSGGPAFLENNDQLTLSTITCGGTGNAEFGSQSINTRLDNILPWIIATAPGAQVLGPTPFQERSRSLALGKSINIYLGITGFHKDEINASGLPQGVFFDGTRIYGKPTEVGVSNVVIKSVNTFGETTSSFTIQVTDGSPFYGQTSLVLNSNSASFTGRLPIKKGLTLKGVRVRVAIFGIEKTFKLDGKGTAKLKDGSSFALSSKLVSGKLVTNNPKFKTTYKNLADISAFGQTQSKVYVSLLGKKFSVTVN